MGLTPHSYLGATTGSNATCSRISSDIGLSGPVKKNTSGSITIHDILMPD